MKLKLFPSIPSACVYELHGTNLQKFQPGLLLSQGKGNPYGLLAMIFNRFKSEHGVMKSHLISLKTTRVHLGVHNWY